jgi:hypothetical protein
VDKHLEKATGTVPVITVPVAGAPSTTTPASDQSAAAPTTTTEPENTRGLQSFISKLPLMKKKSASKESLNTTSQTAPTPLKPVDEAAHKATKDAVASGDEEEEEGEYEGSEDDEDVVSDNKKSERKKFVDKC